MRPLRARRAIVLLGVGLALAAAGGSAVLAANGPSPAKLAAGKKLYRTYCGQCHALAAARAVGFGSNKGLGQDGGPSFNPLRVPFELSVIAVRQPFIGHEELYKRMKWNQIQTVATFVATATRGHPVLAQYVDG